MAELCPITSFARAFRTIVDLSDAADLDATSILLDCIARHTPHDVEVSVGRLGPGGAAVRRNNYAPLPLRHLDVEQQELMQNQIEIAWSRRAVGRQTRLKALTTAYSELRKLAPAAHRFAIVNNVPFAKAEAVIQQSVAVATELCERVPDISITAFDLGKLFQDSDSGRLADAAEAADDSLEHLAAICQLGLGERARLDRTEIVKSGKVGNRAGGRRRKYSDDHVSEYVRLKAKCNGITAIAEIKGWTVAYTRQLGKAVCQRKRDAATRGQKSACQPR